MTASKRPITLEDYWQLRRVSDLQVSPDGTTAAYVVNSYNEAKNSEHSAIWLAAVDSGEARQFTSGEALDSQPRWSSDGSQMAFVSTRHEGIPQIYLIALQGGEPRRLTTHTLGASAPVWSPDGQRLCYTVMVESNRQQVVQEIAWLEAHSEADQKAPKLRLQETLVSRFDGRGYSDKRAQLFILDLQNPDASPQQITEGDANHGEAVWSPDGALIAFAAARATDAAEYFASDIWTVNPVTLALTCLTNGELSASAPVWSPNSASIAFYAAPDMSSSGYHDRHLWLVSAGGGDGRDLSGQYDRAIDSAQPDYMFEGAAAAVWSRDGNTLFFPLAVGRDTHVFALDLATATIHQISRGPADVIAAQPGADGQLLVCLASTPVSPYDLFTVPAAGGTLRPLAATNAALVDRVALSEPRELSFSSVDGLQVEGWLYTPEATERYPLVLLVHGGPYGKWGRCFQFVAQVLAAKGYAALYINPRGSTGYGQEFARSDWGLHDFDDLMAGVDAALAGSSADPHRLAVTGISYGGFMTNWALGHTDRFKVGAATNGVSSFFSMYGVSDITAQWFRAEFGGPYWTSEEQWQRYRFHSPISAVDRITAPLLLLQSENDYRCPIDQGEQLLTALLIQHRTARLVRFPGCSHVIAMSGTPHQRYLEWKLILDWFAQYLP